MATNKAIIPQKEVFGFVANLSDVYFVIHFPLTNSLSVLMKSMHFFQKSFIGCSISVMRSSQLEFLRLLRRLNIKGNATFL